MSNLAYKYADDLNLPQEKVREIVDFLASSYWGKDIWNIQDSIFLELGCISKKKGKKNISFSLIKNQWLKNEIKYFLAKKLLSRKIKLSTIQNYSSRFKRLLGYIEKNYPNIQSIYELEEKDIEKFKNYLIRGKVSDGGHAFSLLRQWWLYFKNFYDLREEYKKDIWDIRKLFPEKVQRNIAIYSLNFTYIKNPNLRELVKKYIRNRIANVSFSQSQQDLFSITIFVNFYYEIYNENTLINLNRTKFEKFLLFFNKSHERHSINTKKSKLLSIRLFLEYIQKADYPEAPKIPIDKIIFKEDFPKNEYKGETIKYIPEDVLQQLDENLQYLKPKEYIPIVILLRATGWRISDILNLRYHKCLQKTNSGWYLVGDIRKTRVIEHRVPITEEVAQIVKAVVEDVKQKSNEDNNPEKYLFPVLSGRRKGQTISSRAVREALNRLAKERNIVDKEGNIYHFGNHAFRHTKAVELINSGMNLLHVQKWLAHLTPVMTLHYAKVLDETLRKSWEEITKKGLFRLDGENGLIKVDISDIENEDVIEWEWIRYNLDAVRMPLGYCMKPSKMECATQLNPCLTCRSFCTTPEFIPAFEEEIRQTKEIIRKGEMQGRTLWVQKNKLLLEKLENIVEILKQGKIKHDAGKRGREYVGEERERIKKQQNN